MTQVSRRYVCAAADGNLSLSALPGNIVLLIFKTNRRKKIKKETTTTARQKNVNNTGKR